MTLPTPPMQPLANSALMSGTHPAYGPPTGPPAQAPLAQAPALIRPLHVPPTQLPAVLRAKFARSGSSAYMLALAVTHQSEMNGSKYAIWWGATPHAR